MINIIRDRMRSMFSLRKQRPAAVELIAGAIDGQPIVAALIRGDGFQEQLAQANRDWFDSLSPQEQAEHLAWEEQETDKWLVWAKKASDK